MRAAGLPLPAALSTELDAAVAAAQREWRAPSVVTRVVRRGHPVLDSAHGAADLGEHGDTPEALLLPGPDVQYRMGSVTKTFTAALVMQARDEGLLDLDGRLDPPAGAGPRRAHRSPQAVPPVRAAA